MPSEIQIMDDSGFYPCDDPDHGKLRNPNDPLDIDPVIALVDMDCFYVQVELRLQPEFRGKPAGVTQYLTRYKGGGLIAVNYEARAHGVKRGFRADEAKEKCPDFKAFVVPEQHGKADLTRYREAGAEVIKVMQKYFTAVERASIDEAYIDLTKEIKAQLPKYLSGELSLTPDELGATCPAEWTTLESWLDFIALHREEAIPGPGSNIYRNNLALAIGAKLMNELRARILDATEFHCSAGISYSKTLAKLCCGLNKPKKQTVLSRDRVAKLFEKTEIQDMRFLGGKLGEQIVQYLNIKYMSELCKTSKTTLFRFFTPKTAAWLADLVSGWDNEPVEPRDLAKSIGCSKNFLGKAALKTREEVRKWIAQFCEELSFRLKKDQEENDRTASLLTSHMTFMEGSERKSLSRCCPCTSYEVAHLAKDAFGTVDKCMSALGYSDGRYTHPLVSVGIVASKMKDGKEAAMPRIDSFFEAKKIEPTSSGSDVKLPVTPDMFDDADTGDMGDRSFSEAVGASPFKSASKAHDDGSLLDIVEVDADKSVVMVGSSEDEPEEENPETSMEVISPGRRPSTSKTSTEDSGEAESLNYPAFTCDKCKLHVWCPQVETEHNDYHMALELSQQINKQDPNAPKRKLKLEDTPIRKKAVSKKSSSAVLTLDHFFKKD